MSIMFEWGQVGLQMEATAPHALPQEAGRCAMICFMLRYIPKTCLIIDVYACSMDKQGRYLIIHRLILFYHGKHGALEGEPQQLSLFLKTQPHAPVQKYSRHLW